ncbi:class I adenylate-forming enzyme family protein [Nocardia xishanensis]|uniref:Class I adenylate-forming enzyme family protein n=1 Tax=Nocardia xishanensis TaxID=238964 RepID=A0ABW7XBQ4_9NOCA
MIHTDVIAPVPALLKQHAALRPNDIAFMDEHKSISYEDLELRTSRLAGHLAEAGVTDGERLVMYLDNCVEAAEGYLVAPRAGIVTVCADPKASADELRHILTDSASRAVLTDREHLDTVMTLVDSGLQGVQLVILVGQDDDKPPHPDSRVVSYDDLVAIPPLRSPADATDLDTWCWMLYTSGTTGRPKGVRLTQRGCLWVVGACWKPIIGLGPGDVLLSALPLFHSYTLVLCVLAVSATGATGHLLAKFSPREILERLRTERVTVFPGVPTMFRYLLDTADQSALAARDLRVCISAGAVMPGHLNRDFEQFAGLPLLDGYGITETSTMVTMNSPLTARPLGSCGVPLPGLTVRLVDPVTGKDAPIGEEGEIWVQGPNVMVGYHNLPEATSNVMRDGWYRTGDLARRDANGYLTISGRIKELIIRGGENIYPAEIENVLAAIDSVADAAVVAAPHDGLGEVPIAFVVPAAGCAFDPDALRSACLRALAKYKVPVDFVEVTTIPRTGSGKVRRHLLKRTGTAGTEPK